MISNYSSCKIALVQNIWNSLNTKLKYQECLSILNTFTMANFNDPPNKFRFYYGWAIVFALFLASFSRVPFTGYVFGVFLKPMSEELHWSRSEIAGAVTGGTILAGISAIFVGRFIDKYGPRIIFFSSGMVIGATLIFLSTVKSLMGFYVIYIIGRTFAQSVNHHGMGTAVASKWFTRQRARAIALVSLGGPSGGLILLLISHAVISGYGWRTAWLVLGFLSWIISVIPASLILRASPKEIDTEPEPKDTSTISEQPLTQSPVISKGTQTYEYSWELSQAIKTRAFWELCFVGGFVHMITTSIVFHMLPYFTDVGIPNSTAVFAFTIYSMVSVVATLAWGATAERYGAHKSMIGAVFFLTVSSLALTNVSGTVFAFLSAALLGIGAVGTTMLIYALWPFYFGKRFLGSIQGAGLMFNHFGNAMGPLFAAVVFDSSANYTSAFIADTVLGVFTLIILFFSRPPKPSAQSQHSP